MKRRTFTKISGTSMLLPTLSIQNNLFGVNKEVAALVSQLIQENDSQIPDKLVKQERDDNSPWYGGIRTDTEVFYPGHAAGFIKNLSCSFVSQESDYYQSPELLNAMMLASAYLLNVQYRDGNIDLPSTNFHSPPDTAFAVEPLCIAYALLDRIDSGKLDPLKHNLQNFLLQAGQSLLVGGIHTANHRWVVCMALARLNRLFPNPDYLDRIDQWLAEKIDIDEDGQYAEKSTLIYTPLVNRCLITLARLTDKPELFNPVRKNLDMTMYYIHPNGEIATESSGRQDRYQRGTMQNYLYAYRYISLLDKNGKFASMTENIQNLEPGKLLFWLGYFLEDPFLSKSLPYLEPLPKSYVKEFYHSDLVRIRRGNMDATMLGANPIFFTSFKGNAALEGVRVASAFFGKGQFRGMTIEKTDNGFKMSQKLSGPYYQPLDPDIIPEDRSGWEVPRMRRKLSEVQEQETVVEIKEDDEGHKIIVSVSGTDNVPVAVEFAFRIGGRFNDLEKVTGIDHAYLAAEGQMMSYTFGADTITFGPGKREHAWTQLRGALPKLEADCVYFTGYTPFEASIMII
jgi:hypothetical protein